MVPRCTAAFKRFADVPAGAPVGLLPTLFKYKPINAIGPLVALRAYLNTYGFRAERMIVTQACTPERTN